MTKTIYTIQDALLMTTSMCERVNLHIRAGRFIMFTCQLKQRLPGGLVNMVEVAQLIKYASEHQVDLKPQFRSNTWKRNEHMNKGQSANFTFLK